MTAQPANQHPRLYKGLALFTPGGDLVYCIDPSKQGHWHAQLCIALQQLLELSVPPLFLTPCYTATVDRWLDAHTQELCSSAEVYPRVWRYRVLLSQLFAVDVDQWQLLSAPSDICDPPILLSYQDQFPQLWEPHNLVVQLNQATRNSRSSNANLNLSTGRSALRGQPTRDVVDPFSTRELGNETELPQGYVLRLFVSNHNPQTTRVLEKLHDALDQAIRDPYTLKIVDVTKHPDQAEAAQVTATPTLVRMWPLPVKRVVGGLEQTERILQLLDDQARK